MNNPYSAVYPTAAAGHREMQQPIATAPPPGFAVVPPQDFWSTTNTTTYPDGLRYLMNLDHLFMNQKIEMLQVFTGWETKNRYTVTDIGGNTIFYVAEESGICSRLCLGSFRSCEFSLLNQDRREVLRMTRPFRCASCCCPCYLQTMEVYSEGIFLGSITQEWSLWRPTFLVRDATGNPVLTIKGPIIRFCFEVSFKIKSLDEKHNVGVIQKQWSGFAQEFLTVSDMFGVSFPRDLDVKMKAVLLGACILIDFMYFEN